MSKCYSQKPKWLPEKWNNLHPDDLKITNCYSYAFNRVRKIIVLKIHINLNLVRYQIVH